MRRREDLDQQRIAGRGIAGMLRRTIAARTGAETAQKVDLGEELDVIARTHRAGFHEVLSSVAGEPGTHEDIQHVMHMRLGLT